MDRSATELDRRIDELIRRCRDAGMNVTPQRLAVYRALLESDDHPSPEILFQRVRKTMPSLSLATIYKALDALEGLGVVEQVATASDTKRFDANGEHHHHLVCTRCQKVVDLYDPVFDALTAPRHLAGFVAQTLSVQVKGLCAACVRLAKKGRRR
jgi:Fur family transcriptional regulator, peroxide stress response regulator